MGHWKFIGTRFIFGFTFFKTTIFFNSKLEWIWRRGCLFNMSLKCKIRRNVSDTTHILSAIHKYFRNFFEMFNTLFIYLKFSIDSSGKFKNLWIWAFRQFSGCFLKYVRYNRSQYRKKIKFLEALAACRFFLDIEAICWSRKQTNFIHNFKFMLTLKHSVNESSDIISNKTIRRKSIAIQLMEILERFIWKDFV